MPVSKHGQQGRNRACLGPPELPPAGRRRPSGAGTGQGRTVPSKHLLFPWLQLSSCPSCLVQAADALLVLGIGRNEYIAALNACKARRLMWRVNINREGIAREQLPQVGRGLRVWLKGVEDGVTWTACCPGSVAECERVGMACAKGRCEGGAAVDTVRGVRVCAPTTLAV